jgi:hypothetical protein
MRTMTYDKSLFRESFFFAIPFKPRAIAISEGFSCVKRARAPEI